MTYTSLYLSEKGGMFALVNSATLLSSFDSPNVVASIHFGAVTSTPTNSTATTTPSTNTPTVTTSSSTVITLAPEYIGPSLISHSRPPVLLSELFPNPTTGDEYIEIVNTSGEGFDVSGVWLRDASGVAYALGTHGENTILGAYESRVWPRATTHIALNNSDGETVTLIDASGAPIDYTYYDGDAAPDAAFARFGNGWQWTQTPTPSGKNYFVAEELPPVPRAVIPKSKLFVGESLAVSAVDSTDPNDSISDYNWNFGDGTEIHAVTTTHAYDYAGNFDVKLTLVDSFGEKISVSKSITVLDTNHVATSTPTIATSTASIIKSAGIELPAPTKKQTAVKKSPKYYGGIVMIPPGVLGKKTIVVNHRTVEFTSDRTELPHLVRGSIVQFTAQEIFKSDRLILQVKKQNSFSVTALTTAPAYENLRGEITAVSSKGFTLTTSSVEYDMLAGQRTAHNEQIAVGDSVSIGGVLLTDESEVQTFVGAGAQNLTIIKHGQKNIGAVTGQKQNILLLLASVILIIIVHLTLSHHPQKIKNAMRKKLEVARLFISSLQLRH
ncbi:MAG: PKD domain-containing protein [Candidatus Magasanikbacteria bacterium]|nr:PKD domain-containing protein [Candidatus Magasanikbacteria bacterium]